MLFATALCLSLLSLVHGQCVYKTVAFTAALSQDANPRGNQIVVYDSVISNYGKAYDSTTGVFTAPTGGIYIFHVHALSLKSEEAWLEIAHNDNYIVSVYAKENDNYDAAGNSATLNLKEGDRVNVRAHRMANLFGRSDELYNTFSGRLIASTSS